MTLRKVANAWAAWLNSAIGRDDSYQKALTAYAIEGGLAIAYGTVLLIVAGWLAGVLWTALVVAFASALLKTFAGGPHLSSPTRCAFAGALIFTAIAAMVEKASLSQLRPQIFWGLVILDNLLIWLYAPVESPGKPLKPKQRLVLGIIARLLGAGISLASARWPENPWVTAIFAGFSMQCLSLGKAARSVFSWIDSSLNALKRSPEHITRGRRCGD